MSEYGKNNTMEAAGIPAEMGEKRPTAKKGTVVNAPFVNVRQDPTPDSKVLTTVKKGDRLNIKKQLGEYYMVDVDGYAAGYIRTRYLKEDES